MKIGSETLHLIPYSARTLPKMLCYQTNHQNSILHTILRFRARNHVEPYPFIYDKQTISISYQKQSSSITPQKYLEKLMLLECEGVGIWWLGVQRKCNNTSCSGMHIIPITYLEEKIPILSLGQCFYDMSPSVPHMY